VAIVSHGKLTQNIGHSYRNIYLAKYFLKKDNLS